MIRIIVIGKVNCEGKWFNCVWVLFFSFFNQSVLRNHSVRKVVAFVTTNTQLSLKLVGNTPVILIFLKSQVSVMGNFKIKCVFCHYEWFSASFIKDSKNET